MPSKILWLAACLSLSVIACNDDDTTNDNTNNNGNGNQNVTPPCTGNGDCTSGQYCNAHATCQPKVIWVAPARLAVRTATRCGPGSSVPV